MTRADQLKSLFVSHLRGEDERFMAVAMQVAAHEAKRGHTKLAAELQAVIDQGKMRRQRSALTIDKISPISHKNRELDGLLHVTHPKARLGAMVLHQTLSKQLERVIREQQQAVKILAHGLQPRRKLLLMGPPGTGKTMTASVLAGELGLPLLQVRLDSLITKYMGETSARLRQVFDVTSQTRGLYFFDEFDAIGSQRGLTNDVGEVRRILNSFLQMIEQEKSHSLILAATNHPEILDPALFRRFDDVLCYQLPDKSNITSILISRLKPVISKRVSWKRLASNAEGLSHAEVTRAADEVLKKALLDEHLRISEVDIQHCLEERRQIIQQFTNLLTGS